MDSELLAVPILEFERRHAQLEQAKSQLQQSAQKAVQDLIHKLEAKTRAGEQVDPGRVAEGLERIRVKLQAFTVRAEQQQEELAQALHNAEQRSLAFVSWPEEEEEGNSNKLELALVANYMLRQGYFASFHALCKEEAADQQSPTTLQQLLARDLPVFERRHGIVQELTAAASPAEYDLTLRFCSDFAEELHSQRSPLLFQVRLQQFRQLAPDKLAAIEFARAHLSQHAHQRELQRALVRVLLPPPMGLLAKKGSDTSKRPRSDIVAEEEAAGDSPSAQLVREFTRASDRLHYLLPVPPLEALLRLGLIVYKTAACRAAATTTEKATPAEEPQCPCCDKNLGQLARGLPMVRKTNSVFVCRMSHRVSTNILVFPGHGEAYSAEALELAKTGTTFGGLGGGRVTDPKTGEECAFGDLRRAFLL